MWGTHEEIRLVVSPPKPVAAARAEYQYHNHCQPEEKTSINSISSLHNTPAMKTVPIMFLHHPNFHWIYYIIQPGHKQWWKTANPHNFQEVLSATNP